jgi:hypothetical protein
MLFCFRIPYFIPRVGPTPCPVKCVEIKYDEDLVYGCYSDVVFWVMTLCRLQSAQCHSPEEHITKFHNCQNLRFNCYSSSL